VQTNPFAKEAIKESINVSRIEKNNQNFEKMVEALKKYRNYMYEKLNKVISKMDELIGKDTSF
jgi:hypothetical protein